MNRRLRLGMVGGGLGGFFGEAHRRAAALTDDFELVAGALSSDAARAATSAAALHIAPDRSYASYASMAQAEAARDDGIDLVAIVVPNHLHHEVARAFLARGVAVVCDKPLTTDPASAQALADLAHENRVPLVVTYTNAGFTMVREARHRVRAGQIGTIRTVRVSFPQEWLAHPVEHAGNAQARWRTDPALAGAGTLADIGCHAFHLCEYVTGLRATHLSATGSSFVEGREVEDDVDVRLRFECAATASLWVSQIAIGESNGLSIAVYGTEGSLRWTVTDANHLALATFGGVTRTIERGADDGIHHGWLPAGHPEGFIEALARLYADTATLLGRRTVSEPTSADNGLLPDAAEGARGVHFIRAALDSMASDGAWTVIT